MGTVEIIDARQLLIRSHIVTYGNAADEEVTELIRSEIETMWNEPAAEMLQRGELCLRFSITATCRPDISPDEIMSNTDPLNNYFRIERTAQGNISFVDGIGSNTGYFLLENLYAGSTTAAHEYGHTLGLVHPTDLDLRGKGVPGIMYPRGTIVDPPFQYNPASQPGDSNNGGTMHPKNRRVLPADILALHPSNLRREKLIGDFTSIWHPDHASVDWNTREIFGA